MAGNALPLLHEDGVRIVVHLGDVSIGTANNHKKIQYKLARKSSMEPR